MWRFFPGVVRTACHVHIIYYWNHYDIFQGKSQQRRSSAQCLLVREESESVVSSTSCDSSKNKKKLIIPNVFFSHSYYVSFAFDPHRKYIIHFSWVTRRYISEWQYTSKSQRETFVCLSVTEVTSIHIITLVTLSLSYWITLYLTNSSHTSPSLHSFKHRGVTRVISFHTWSLNYSARANEVNAHDGYTDMFKFFDSFSQSMKMALNNETHDLILSIQLTSE